MFRMSNNVINDQALEGIKHAQARESYLNSIESLLFINNDNNMR